MLSLTEGRAWGHAWQQLEEPLLQRFFSGPWRVAWEEKTPGRNINPAVLIPLPSPSSQNQPRLGKQGVGEDGGWKKWPGPVRESVGFTTMKVTDGSGTLYKGTQLGTARWRGGKSGMASVFVDPVSLAPGLHSWTSEDDVQPKDTSLSHTHIQ